MSDRLKSALWRIAVPLMLLEVTETIVHVVDTVFLGRLEASALAALAVADSILEISVVVSIGLVEATQIMVARRTGEAKPEGVGPAFDHALLFLVATSLVVVAALKLASPALATLVSGSEEVAREVNDFLQIAAFGLPFFSLGLAYGGLYVGLGRTRALIVAAVVLLATNALLAFGLVFGNLGMPELGLEGAAFASVGAEIAAFLYLTAYTMGIERSSHLGLFRTRSLDPRVSKTLVALSVPVAAQALVEAIGWLALFGIVAGLGTHALAASNVIFTVFLLLFIPTAGFSETAASLVSNEIGGSDGRGLGKIPRDAVRSVYAVTVPALFAVAVVPDWIASLFTSNDAVVAASGSGLRIVAVAMLLVIPARIWSSALSGTGDTRRASIVELSMTIVMLVVAFFAARSFGDSVAPVWAAMVPAATIGLFMSRAWFRSGGWRDIAV